MSWAKRGGGERARRQVLSFVLVVLLFGVVSAVGFERIRNPGREPTQRWIDRVALSSASFVERCGRGDRQPKLLVVTSPDKVEWVRRGAKRYMNACRNTRIVVVERSDFETITQLEAGEPAPSMWLPSDELFVDYLEESWVADRRPAFERRPSLLRTPMVLMLWPDRARALEALWPRAEDTLELVAELTCPGIRREPFALDPARRRSWADWHFDETLVPHEPLDTMLVGHRADIAFPHPQPTRSTAGVMVLLAMVRGYLGSNGHVPANDDELEFDRVEPELVDWLRRCDRQALLGFQGPPRRLAQRTFQRGPTGFDGAFVYEHHALEIFDRERADLQLMYPRSLPIANHPVVLFAVDERDIAQRFANILASDDMQYDAVRLGLRPGAVDIALRDVPIPGESNPFLRLRSHGVRLELDSDEGHALRPSRDGLRMLMEAWADATGRY